MRRKFSLLVLVCALNWGCGAEALDQPELGIAASATLTTDGTVVLPGIGWGDTGVSGTPRADGSVDWCCTSWIVPLPVAAGDTVGTVTVNVRDNGPGDGFPALADRNSITAMVGTPSADGSNFNALQFATTAANGNTQSIMLTFSPAHVVAAGENLQFRVRAQFPASWPPVPATRPSWVGPVTVKAAAPGGGPRIITAATVNIPVTPGPGRADGPSLGFTSTNWGVNTSTGNDGALFPVRDVPVGATITAVRVKLSDSTSAPATVELLAKEMPGLTAPAWVSKGSATSAGSGAIQLIQFSPGYLVPSSAEMILVAHGISVSPLRVYVAELDYQ